MPFVLTITTSVTIRLGTKTLRRIGRWGRDKLRYKKEKNKGLNMYLDLFFVYMQKKLYLCTRNQVHALELCLMGGQLQDIIKASIALCAWLHGIW